MASWFCRHTSVLPRREWYVVLPVVSCEAGLVRQSLWGQGQCKKSRQILWREVMISWILESAFN